MKTKIARWRSSLAVRLPRKLADALHLFEGAVLDIKVEAGVLLLRPALPRYELKSLLFGITPARMREASPWGPDIGREIVKD
ncbi:MAG: AbrB/MazE/SpoVT family DNA-binding domain-containing protein [Alphaproteobacteria bacterium]|nr:AbrB/MazE/SpoVT family DNA-binding domain-containing protein [Alphaproteobacteria bacterium]